MTKVQLLSHPRARRAITKPRDGVGAKKSVLQLEQ